MIKLCEGVIDRLGKILLSSIKCVRDAGNKEEEEFFKQLYKQLIVWKGERVRDGGLFMNSDYSEFHIYPLLETIGKDIEKFNEK